MSQLESSVLALAMVGMASVAYAATMQPADFGQPLSTGDMARYVSIPPSGAGLPPGHGDAATGSALFAEKCAACHGGKLEGIAATGAPALVGGRGTLTSAAPLKTVESYWPYATTVFDYVKRAMPITAPGSLTDDEVYALTAYILAEGHVIDATKALDATSLPAVVMPNRNGFIRDPRPKS